MMEWTIMMMMMTSRLEQYKIEIKRKMERKEKPERNETSTILKSIFEISIH
jgi:hypothetical protein